MLERFRRALLLVVLLPGLAPAQYVAVPVLVEGETLGGATVQGVGSPAVNPTGQIAIEGNDTHSSLDDFLWVDGIVRISSGDPLAGSPGTLDNVNTFDTTRPISSGGSVAWAGDLDGVPVTADQILARDATVLLTEGDPSPITGRVFQDFSFVSIDDLDRIYFEGDLDGATSGDEVLMVIDGTTVSPIAMNTQTSFREGALIVGGALHGHTWDNGAFIDLRANGSGTIIVEGDLETTGAGLASSLDNEVLVRKQPGLDYELLLREGVTIIQPLVTTAAPIRAIHEVDLADNGDWAIRGALDDSITTLEFDDVAIADFGGLGRFVIAQEGMDLSAQLGAPGAILGAIQGVSLNSNQQVLLLANVESRVAPLPFEEALFLYENGTLSVVLTDELATVEALAGAPLRDLLTDRAHLGENGEITFGAKVELGAFLHEGVFRAILPPVFPVENFTCQPTPGFPSVSATWTNPAATPYDGIRIFVDGTLVTTLTGGETAYETAPVSPVNVAVELSVEPFIAADLGATRSCTVFVTNPRDIVACRNPALPIVDLTTTVDTVNITSSLTAREVTVSIEIAHTAIGDLDLALTSPTGTTVVLTTNTGANSDDLLATFADYGFPLASTPLDTGLTIAPEGPGTFDDFRCAPIGGDWTLTVADDGLGDLGTWIEWCLNITEEPQPAANCCPLPTDLTAVDGGSCSAGAVELSWQNHATYAALELARDDGMNAIALIPLPSNATSFTDSSAPAGIEVEYSLRTRCVSTGLWLSIPGPSLTPDPTHFPTITEFTANADVCAGSIGLAWSPSTLFGSLELWRDGVFLADVTGVGSYTDTTPPAGAIEYQLIASCGSASTSATLVAQHELLPPADLLCTTDSSNCDGIVTLTWTNAAPYTSIELRIDGLATPAALSPGDTSYTSLPLPAGEHIFEWFVECNGAVATAACSATVTLPPNGQTEAILALEGTRTGGNRGAIDSGRALADALVANGKTVYLTAPVEGGDILTGLPCAVDLTAFDRVWVILGTFPNDDRLTAAEGDFLALLNRDFEIPIYLESGDHWGFQPTASALDLRDGIEPGGIVDGDNTFTAMAARPTAALDLLTPFPLPILYGQDNPNGPEYTDRLTLAGETPGVPIDSEVLTSVALWANSPDASPDPNDPDEALAYTTAALTTPTIGAPMIVQSWEFGGFGHDAIDPAASDPLRATLAGHYLFALGGPPPGATEWIRGDTNDDGVVNLADAIYLLNALFPGGLFISTLECLDAADANGDLALNIADAISILEALFLPGATAIPPPNASGGCGTSTLPGLGCAHFSHCP